MATTTEQPPVPQQRRFTVEEYHRMAEADVFAPDDRLELLDGQIYVMSPIRSNHASCVDRLTRLFVLRTRESTIVRVQNPLRLDQRSEPEPDLALVHPNDEEYQNRHPRPEETLLVVEVADSSAHFNREVKLPLYAQAGIPELWIVDLTADRIEVHRSPRDSEYTDTQPYERRESVSVQELSTLDPFAVEELLGPAQ